MNVAIVGVGNISRTHMEAWKHIPEATVVAVVRSGKSYPSPKADFVLAGGDIVVLTAAHQNLERTFLYLETGAI